MDGKETVWLEVATGTLERNDKKERDGQPDYKGKLKLTLGPDMLKQIGAASDEGTKVFISGWQKEGEKDGKEYKFMSLSVSYPSETESTKVAESSAEPF